MNPASTRIGFIGLGQLGRAICQRLISQRSELVVWNRDLRKAEGLGATVVKSPSDVVSQTSLTFLCLFDSISVEAVLAGPSGVLAGDCSGKVICDITTNHFESVKRFSSLIAERGGAYLETPVLGSVSPALQGNLVVLVSGDEAAYQKAKPWLEVIGSKTFYLPERSTATKMKLINNVMLGAFMTSIAEGIALAEAGGVSKETALDIFGVGAGNSGVLTAKRSALLNEDFIPNFSAALIHKDLTYLHDLAAHLGVSDKIASTAREIFAQAIAAGFGSQDFSVVYKTMKKNS